MRCLPIRSVFRAALLAGLIGSNQYATASASWKDCMPPRNGSCFIHDLHWERFQPQPINPTSLVHSESQVDSAGFEAADPDLTRCLAAANQFELKQQVDAIQAAIKSRVEKFPSAANDLAISFARSKKMFFSIFENQKLQLVKAAVAPETVPVLAVVPQEEHSYDQDWNCGDWCQSYTRPAIDSMPSREVANLFIYTLETSVATSGESICPDAVAKQANSEIVDSCAMAYSEYFADNLLTEAEIRQWNSAIATEFSHPWQVGVDPVCPEVQSTDIANLSSSTVETQSVCCPVENALEAIGTVANAAAPQGDVDDSSISKANMNIASTMVETHSVADLALRPPMLEAEIEIMDSNPAIEFQGQRPVHCLISDFDAGVYRSDNEIDMVGDYDYSHSWLSSVRSPSWPNGQGKRFAFGDHSPRMPIATPPVAAFSKEDLEFANRFSADLLGNLTDQVVDAGVENLEHNQQGAAFLSKDFLTTLQTSAYGSIMLPVNQAQRMAMDYAAKLISEPASTTRTHASRKVANQLRKVGQFLVDFATQIENRVEQVEIARGENKQQESNQR